MCTTKKRKKNTHTEATARGLANFSCALAQYLDLNKVGGGGGVCHQCAHPLNARDALFFISVFVCVCASNLNALHRTGSSARAL